MEQTAIKNSAEISQEELANRQLERDFKEFVEESHMPISIDKIIFLNKEQNEKVVVLKKRIQESKSSHKGMAEDLLVFNETAITSDNLVTKDDDDIRDILEMNLEILSKEALKEEDRQKYNKLYIHYKNNPLKLNNLWKRFFVYNYHKEDEHFPLRKETRNLGEMLGKKAFPGGPYERDRYHHMSLDEKFETIEIAREFTFLFVEDLIAIE